MYRLIDDITSFLESNGFVCSRQMRHGLEFICTSSLDGRHERMIFPLEIRAADMEEAAERSEVISAAIAEAATECGYPLIIAEDRWKRQRSMMESRLLAHLEIFSQAYARNCEVRRIEKGEAAEFLTFCHSYGYASCRYHYGLFLKRHTGHIAAEREAEGARCEKLDRLIAVATFSNGRKWIKDGKEIRSYEWTRYASLPDMRISGGMGKMLRKFINDVKPDDIMSYADLEWSEGGVYETLGFVLEDTKGPVMFRIGKDWKRTAVKPGMSADEENLYFRNFGSNKYRLKLTEYE